MIIGLNSDLSVKNLKGKNRPINSQSNRAYILAALEVVDYVVIFDEDTPLELIELIKPDILVKGSDYKGKEVIGSEIAKELRDISKQATGQKKENIMDVNPSEVFKTMEKSSVNLLIHGHTHRPDSHDIEINNKPAKRIVLGDWDKYGWYLWMDSSSCELKKFSIS